MNPQLLFQVIVLSISVWCSSSFRIQQNIPLSSCCVQRSPMQRQFLKISHNRPEFKTYSHVATLDDPFLPATLLPTKLPAALFVTLAAVAVGTTIRQNSQSILNSALNLVFRNRKPAAESTVKSTIPSNSVKPKSAEQKPWRLTDWGTCSLEKIDILNDKYTLFKFRISQRNPLPPSGLGIGRKITLCSPNNKGIPVKESFYPLSSMFSKSTFEVVVPTASSPIHTVFSSLSLGDEVAFKLGKNELAYRGHEVDIKSFTLVACGTGILPMVQFLRRILANKEFNIERCELLWINDKREDFICNNELEKLEGEHEEIFSCARVLDTNISSLSTDLNENVQDALPNYEVGRVALIAGPTTVTSKFAKTLEATGYPMADIISLEL